MKRLHAECGALPGREGSLLSFPFPRKLWTIVNSHCFVSIWWAEDSTCISVNEELFENILERVGSDKVFETDHKKSLFRQLSLYGFSKACQDVLTSLCLTTLLTEEPPVCVLSKVKVREYLLGPGGRVDVNLRASRAVASLQGELCVKTGLGTGVTAGAASAARCVGEL